MKYLPEQYVAFEHQGPRETHNNVHKVQSASSHHHHADLTLSSQGYPADDMDPTEVSNRGTQHQTPLRQQLIACRFY